MNRNGRRRRRRAQRAYGMVVRLYPRAHRREFGEQMVQAFGDHYRDAIQERGDSRLRFWMAVLADSVTSLLTEHAARRPRPPKTPKRLRAVKGERRRVRAARRLRYHRPVRVLIRTPYYRLVYRGRIAVLIVFGALTGAVFGTMAALGQLGAGVLVAGLAVIARVVLSLRLTRAALAGPRGDGPAPPGGASVREPRRPLPFSPSGSVARPAGDQDEPGQAIAVI